VPSEGDVRFSEGYIKADQKSNFQAKIFTIGSCFGIKDGRVSKLFVKRNNKVLFNYERGIDIPPRTLAIKQFVMRWYPFLAHEETVFRCPQKATKVPLGRWMEVEETTMQPNMNPRPTALEVAETLEDALGLFVDMTYDRIHPRRPRDEQEWLRFVPEDRMKGFTGADQGRVFRSNPGNLLFATRMITRRSTDNGEFGWRSLRVDGMRIDTILINNGSQGLIRLFPNVPPGYKVQPATVSVSLEEVGTIVINETAPVAVPQE